VARLLDLLLPRRCVGCGRGELPLCGLCRAELRPLRPPLCARCGAPTAWPVERCSECAGRRLAFRTARAGVGYDRTARALVLGWKERGLRRLAGEAAALVAEAVERPDVEALAFVPGDGERLLWRGHNTAEALARALAARWELPVVEALARTGRASRQRGRGRVERRANVRGAFRPRGEAPRRLALVDDVYTTGATANAAASALRKGGARAVDVVTFARALRAAA
jgi:predicted amidophosphoribosyltransferase